MRSTILPFGLIFILRSQASFLSHTFHNSVIYKSCFGGSLSDIPLNMSPNMVEVVKDEIPPTVNNTNVDEQDDRQINSGSDQASVLTVAPSTNASNETSQAHVMSILRRDFSAKTTTRGAERSDTNLSKSSQAEFAKNIILTLIFALSRLIFRRNVLDSISDGDDSHLFAETTGIVHDSIQEMPHDSHPSKEITDRSNPGEKGFPSHSRKQLLRRKIQNQKSKKDALVLRDSTNSVEDVQPVNDQFKVSKDQRKFDDTFELAWSMGSNEFLKQIFTTVKTFEQFKELVNHNNLMKSFYLHGDLRIIKEAIAESRVREDNERGGQLAMTLPQVLKEDCHDRFIELLNVRKEISAEEDETLKEEGRRAGFETFVYLFLENLAPWKDGMALRRFFTLKGDELRSEHPDIFDTLCQTLMWHLSDKLDDPSAKKLLTDLIGQPSLITPEVFAKGFLRYGTDASYSAFIKYAWNGAIQEGLKNESLSELKFLWRVMKEEYPLNFFGPHPSTATTKLATVLAKFPTKQGLEEQWNKKSVMILFSKIEGLDFLPNVLWFLISEYAVSLTITEDSTTFTQ